MWESESRQQSILRYLPSPWPFQQSVTRARAASDAANPAGIKCCHLSVQDAGVSAGNTDAEAEAEAAAAAAKKKKVTTIIIIVVIIIAASSSG